MDICSCVLVEYFFLGPLVKFSHEVRVKGGDFGFIATESAGGGMLAEPQFHQSHEYSAGMEIGMIQSLCLSLPFCAQLAGYFFNEGAKLIELLFCAVAVEQIEVGVVVHLPFLRPKVRF